MLYLEALFRDRNWTMKRTLFTRILASGARPSGSRRAAHPKRYVNQRVTRAAIVAGASTFRK